MLLLLQQKIRLVPLNAISSGCPRPLANEAVKTAPVIIIDHPSCLLTVKNDFQILVFGYNIPFD